ncbi:MAG: hypothetical protein ACFE89_01660 [Candidatus Hodarchaeota archaeon]
MTDNTGSSSLQLRLARITSLLLSPPLVALVAVGLFAFLSPIGTGLLFSWQSFLLGLFFVVIGPVLPLSTMVILGRITFDVKNRRDRPLLYFAAILVYSTGAFIAWLYLNYAMMVIAIAYAGVTTAIALISLFWKVSAHSAGVAGPLTGLIWVFGVILLPFMSLVGLVAWARWREGLHNVAQLVVGILTAILVTAGVYWFLWGAPLFIL